ncbi:MAG: phosphoribosylformylglycinamidine synthase subunit PurL [Limnochordales bacterium]|nr:phosphoribosylformylglycinamidine synthase subunit PurL [Limnochordales bacterium]
MKASTAPWRAMGLKDHEYERITALLGREPNRVELGMFAVLWSEHCAYKHSRRLLKRFPTEGEAVVVGPGENAGVVDVGAGDTLVAFRMESHNRPSAVDPFQGAATGVGGILRDILSMGAQPVAVLSSLRLGDLREERVRWLLRGIVAGMGNYARGAGVAVVGGEGQFLPGYRHNPLVNAMAVGLVPRRRLTRAVATGVGNAVIYVGAPTGRDGIHGATFASDQLDEGSAARRSAVAVGDPETGRRLIAACLELVDTGGVVGIQDMGAAGLTSSCAETATRGGCGVELDLDQVPTREDGMDAYEIMLSESQERMLVIVQQGHEEAVHGVCRRHGLLSARIGTVIGEPVLRVRHRGAVAAEVPVRALTEEAPVYDPPARPPADLAQRQALDLEAVPVPADLGEVLLRLLASPTIADKAWVYRRLQPRPSKSGPVLAGPVGAGEPAPAGSPPIILGPGQADAAVIGIPGTQRALALTVDGNARYCQLDPFTGGMIAVAEAARNVVCAGARPVAITNNLNFGSPEKPEVFWTMAQAVAGMSAACTALGTPVTGGNVSLYNEHEGVPIPPTPVVGMVGVLDDGQRAVGMGFPGEGLVVALLGETGLDLGASEYLAVIHGLERGRPPRLDLEAERRVQAACLAAAERGLVRSAHDCAEGGLAVALAECCLAGGVGASVDLSSDLRPDALLFGESQSRIVLSVAPEHWPALQEIAAAYGAPLARLGTTGGQQLAVAINGRPAMALALAELRQAWAGALPALLGDEEEGQPHGGSHRRLGP